MNGIYKTIGASNHCADERQEHDFYATDPAAIDLLFAEEEFNENILEPACGTGHLSDRMQAHGKRVVSSDLVDRGYGAVADFFDRAEWIGDIITNPPYKNALEFVRHALSLIDQGAKVAMFLKLTFLEGKARKLFFRENPPRTVYVYASRARIAKNGNFDFMENSGGNAIAFAWYVWEKGYAGHTEVKWIN